MILIIDEVSFQHNKEQHEENISAIKKEIENLQEKEFLSCLDVLENVVITNDIENTIKKHGYIEMSKGFYAATHKVGNKYDIIIRYDNLHFNEEGAVLADIRNYLFHEFQHIFDHKQYDSFIKNYANEKHIDEIKMTAKQSYFFEFNASYYAQKFYSRKGWTFDTKRFGEQYIKLKTNIDALTMDNVQHVKQLNDDAFYFSQAVMYDLAIVSGANAADNETEQGVKCIGLSVSGINSEIDKLLNRFLDGINDNINENENIIKYLTENGLCIFDYICGLLKDKLKDLKQ